MPAIIRKELKYYFGSIRISIIMALALAAAVLALYGAYHALRGQTIPLPFLGLFNSQVLPNNIPAQYSSYLVFYYFMAYVVLPVTGILLGYDAINAERNSGTFGRLVSQSIYRGDVITAKFAAGIIIITLAVTTSILLTAGYGLQMLGVPPTPPELERIFFFGVTAVIYGTFWMGLAMLFSFAFRRRRLSMGIPFAILVVLGGYVYILQHYPVISSQAIALNVARISPIQWFIETGLTLMIPQWPGMGLALANSNIFTFFLYSTLPVSQALTIVWVQIFGLTLAGIAVYAINRLLFMKKDILNT